MYFYKVDKVNRVVDGDTYDLAVDVGFGIIINHRFRLADVDTPETWRPSCEEERIHGHLSTNYVKDAFDKADAIYIESHKEPGIYGRYTARVLYEINGHQYDLASQLKENDLVKLSKYG